MELIIQRNDCTNLIKFTFDFYDLLWIQQVSAAEISAICQEAGMQAVRRNRYVITYSFCFFVDAIVLFLLTYFVLSILNQSSLNVRIFNQVILFFQNWTGHKISRTAGRSTWKRTPRNSHSIPKSYSKLSNSFTKLWQDCDVLPSRITIYQSTNVPWLYLSLTNLIKTIIYMKIAKCHDESLQLQFIATKSSMNLNKTNKRCDYFLNWRVSSKFPNELKFRRLPFSHSLSSTFRFTPFLIATNNFQIWTHSFKLTI